MLTLDDASGKSRCWADWNPHPSFVFWSFFCVAPAATDDGGLAPSLAADPAGCSFKFPQQQLKQMPISFPQHATITIHIDPPKPAIWKKEIYLPVFSQSQWKHGSRMQQKDNNIKVSNNPSLSSRWTLIQRVITTESMWKQKALSS